MIETVRRCLALLPAADRRRWALVPVLAMLSGVAEAGAAAAVFALIRIIDDPGEALRMPVTAWLAAHLPAREPAAVVLQFTALVALYQIAKNLLLAGAQYARAAISGRSSAALASRLFRGYLLAPYALHFRRDSAELIRNTTRSVSAVFDVLTAAATIASELFVGAGILAVLLATAPGVTIAVAAVLAVLVTALLRWTRRLAARASRAEHALHHAELRALQHALGAIKEIKAFGREEYFHDAFAATQRRRTAIGLARVTLQQLPPLLIETVFVVGALLVVALLTLAGRGAGTPLPVLGLFAYAGFRIIPMANRLTWRINEIRGHASAVRALAEDYELLGPPAVPAAGGAAAGAPHGTLRLDGVSYTYPGAAAPALADVTLAIHRGEALGIVGHTGAGKSTLVDLVVGLLSPGSGRVTVDGIELAALGAAWRRRIGYVPQTIVLLDDTLRRNVALGLPDAEIDEARVYAALRAAQLAEVVASLPAGLDTRLGERGVRLAGGERQRIGIARALYRAPDLLILDEPTAALDPATEAALAAVLRTLRGTTTVLLIAHRLSTVRDCDRIALLAHGRLLDVAPWNELLERNAEFRRLVNA